jgi:hypothetical protein
MTTGSDHMSPESVDHMAEIFSPLRPCLLSLWIQSKTLINVLSVCPMVRGRTAIWFAIVWSLRPRSRIFLVVQSPPSSSVPFSVFER